jgi:hypothetical protein
MHPVFKILLVLAAILGLAGLVKIIVERLNG